MATLTKFAFGFGLGILALMAWAILQTELPGQFSGEQGALLLNAADASLQSAATQADFELQRAVVEIPFNLKSFSDSSDVFLRRNATTARLQWESMVNTVPAQLAGTEWLPRDQPYWIQGAAQEAGSEADALARKIPVVSQTLGPIGDRIAYLCQSVTGAA